jgi:hypothetical protein
MVSAVFVVTLLLGVPFAILDAKFVTGVRRRTCSTSRSSASAS